MGNLKSFLTETRSGYFLLITVVALNAPLIVASVLANVTNQGLSVPSWFYAVTVAIGYYCLPLLVLVSFVYLLTFALRRLSIALGLAVSAIFVWYLLLDALAYRIVKFHIDPFWIEFALKDHSGFGLPSSTWLVAFSILLAIIAVQIGFVAIARRFPMRRAVAVFPVGVVFAFTFSQIVHVVAHEWNDRSVTGLTPHFPLYMPITSHKNAPKYREMLPWVEAQAAANSSDEESGAFRYPLVDLEFDVERQSRPPNIVVILLESWRYDCMNAAVSPNIYALSERSTVFLDHMSTGNQTTCGVFGLFYGLHATYWSAVKANSADIDNPVLIDALQARGYSFGVYAKSRFKRHKIKDTVFNGIRVNESFKGSNDVDQDADLTDQMMAFIDEQVEHDRPFFAFGFYKSTHAPYSYPSEHEIFEGAKNVVMGFTTDHTDPIPQLKRYGNAVHYVDSLVGRVIDRLEELGQMDRTIVIVTTDHGESFNDNDSNYWGHGSNYTQYQTRIPLVFYDPAREPHRVTYRTSHIDMAPTLLEEYLDCTSDAAHYSNGRVLFEDLPVSRPLAIGSYVNHAFVFGNDVYEIRPLGTKKYKLHDVAADVGWPDSDQLRTLTEELRRFSNQ